MALPIPTPAAAIVGHIGAGTRVILLVSTIAAIGTPSSAELTAGTDVSSWVPPDGLTGFRTTSAFVDDPRTNSRTVGKINGMISFDDSSIKFVLARTGTGDVRGTLHRDDITNVVIFPEGIVTGAKCSVFAVTVGSASPDNDSADAEQYLTVNFAVNSAAENIAIPIA